MGGWRVEGLERHCSGGLVWGDEEVELFAFLDGDGW